MKVLFIDTAGWMSMADASDPVHNNARRYRDHWLQTRGTLVSTNYVMDETLTLIKTRLGLNAARQWWEQTTQSTRLRWEWIDLVTAGKAREWFFRESDKDFSLTDCTSFVVMKELRLKRVLTTDKHFAQAGFICVP